ncbi:MAG: ATP-binding cassette domain-containing protein [Clostridiales bacterium]|nr:ATP-binding cassette domain-containing protein [Clostridiales bacterium]
MDYRPKDAGYDKGSPSDKAPIIKLEGLVKTFKSKSDTVQALKGIDLSIYKGEIFGIIGLSGAGKSTIVRCMNLLERPTSGRVMVDGVDMMSLSKKELNLKRREIAMIFQQFNLLMQRNCLENICFPLEIAGVSGAEAISRAKQLLEVVELSDKAKAYPSQLSGGQKQRIAIARALATNPKVLLCDEATSALDPKTTRAILSLLKRINEEYGITIVVITHEMSVIQQICHTVAIIDNGVIAETGPVTEIFANPQTEAAKKLVFPGRTMTTTYSAKRLVRMVFDGRSTFEPVISNMIMACGEPVNIMYANVQNIDGVSVGQMIIQLSEDRKAADKQLEFLKSQGIKFDEIEEVGIDV